MPVFVGSWLCILPNKLLLYLKNNKNRFVMAAYTDNFNYLLWLLNFNIILQTKNYLFFDTLWILAYDFKK